MREPPPPMLEQQGIVRWSLKGRLLRWLGLTAAAVALSLTGIGAWFVTASTNRQLDALLQEELDEVRIAFPHSAQDAAAFRELADEFDRLHSRSSFAWRVWNPGGETLLGEFGVTSRLLPDAPAREPLDVTHRARGGLRWRSARLSTGHVVGLMIDEEPHFQLVRQYGLVALLFVLAGSAAIFLVGRILCGRVSTLLSRIADRARVVRAPSESLELASADLPEEVREVVEALEKMLGNIREETQASRLLIAGVAHELRSPIQNLIGESEVALLADRDSARYRELLSSHLEELRELRDAVQNLVALCSTPRPSTDAPAEEFDLVEEIQFRLEGELKRARRKGIEVRQQARGESSIRGDREALVTALRNVISNAIDWTPEGGQIRIQFEGEAGELQVTVDDSGPGLPAELRERVFDPFFRGPTAAGKRVGYGLGLALARSAVTAHGGSIVVEDSPEGGARFRLVL